MQVLQAFQRGDGAHRGLTDWYPEKEAALVQALADHKPFDTGWYGSKHAIASARICSYDGVTINVWANVSDDFDTNGLGYEVAPGWTLGEVASAVSIAWADADEDRKDNAPYLGFNVHNEHGAWVETYVLGTREYDTPPGDNYRWWGWQHDESPEGECVPDPRIPADAVAAFEAYVNGPLDLPELTVSGWTIRPWKG
jgi:hypothetical protein